MVMRGPVRYEVSPPPLGGGEASLREWAQKEFARIADALSDGRVRFLLPDVTVALPVKPQQGQLVYFAAGVAGASEGYYEYRATSWQKL